MGTKYKGSSDQVMALNFFIYLLRSSETFFARLRDSIARTDLTLAQFAVLEALYHLGPLTQRQIAAKLLKSHGNITKLIDNLEKKDLVQRGKQPGDRRFFQIKLTEQGEKKVKSILPDHVREITELVSQLSSREIESASQVLRKLGLSLQKKNSSSD